MWDVVVIPADTNKLLYPKKLWDESLQELQGLVGGYIEHVRIGNFMRTPPLAFEDVGMYVNEDGIRLGLMYNSRASLLYGESIHSQHIYGDAVLIGEAPDPEEGRVTTSLPPERKVEFWNKHLKELEVHLKVLKRL